MNGIFVIFGNSDIFWGVRGVWAPYSSTIEGSLLAPVWVGGMGEAAKSGASPDASRVRPFSRTAQSPSLKGYTGQSISATVALPNPSHFAHQNWEAFLMDFGVFWVAFWSYVLIFFATFLLVSVLYDFLDEFVLVFRSILAKMPKSLKWLFDS